MSKVRTKWQWPSIVKMLTIKPMTDAEIAEAIDMTPHAVKARIKECLENNTLELREENGVIRYSLPNTHQTTEQFSASLLPKMKAELFQMENDHRVLGLRIADTKAKISALEILSGKHSFSAPKREVEITSSVAEKKRIRRERIIEFLTDNKIAKLEDIITYLQKEEPTALRTNLADVVKELRRDNVVEVNHFNEVNLAQAK